ncbi:serine/threonine-protein phosphatase 2A regulatory subunit B'' subunit gamma isoform X2 [Gouania willdenowi]|uniref:PP2A regulatory subunit B'' EF-hand domain-containing protein n=1 Tax=Gouania willdenowi TaxID=441366 RepID=A0A8C5GNG5_GOUWI|nr:serine/threonine-protein phosphatase 2A regulatory subunit B'' subunit gamma isoform X2 [Gouania willdenowi]
MVEEEQRHWSNILRKRIANSKSERSKEENKAEETELLTKYYSEWRARLDKEQSYRTVPRFYYRLPAEDEVLLQKLREESRAVFLQRKSRELLDNEELQNLWFLLDKHQVAPLSGDEAMINYEAYLKVGEEAGPKSKKFFTSRVYAKLFHSDPYGRISIMQFFNYVMRKVWLHQTRIGLSLYDVAGRGYLRESDLENYILELIPTLPQLDGLEKSFYSFYVCTAVRKFFFFLDPLRTGKIKIQDILACSFLDDLLELRDEELSKESQESNWFSAPSALRVYERCIGHIPIIKQFSKKNPHKGLVVTKATLYWLMRVPFRQLGQSERAGRRPTIALMEFSMEPILIKFQLTSFLLHMKSFSHCLTSINLQIFMVTFYWNQTDALLHLFFYVHYCSTITSRPVPELGQGPQWHAEQGGTVPLWHCHTYLSVFGQSVSRVSHL